MSEESNSKEIEPTAEDEYVEGYSQIGEEHAQVRELLSLTGIESKDSIEKGFDYAKHERYMNYLAVSNEMGAKRKQLARLAREINRLTREIEEETETESDCESETDAEAEPGSDSECELTSSEDSTKREEGKKSKKKPKKRSKKRESRENKERKIRALRNLYEEENLELIILMANAMRLREEDADEGFEELGLEPIGDSGPTDDNMYQQLVEAVCGSMGDDMDLLKGPCAKSWIPPLEEESSEEEVEPEVKTEPKKRKKTCCRDKIIKNMIDKLQKMQGFLQSVAMKKGSEKKVLEIQNSIYMLKRKLFEMCKSHGGPSIEPITDSEAYEIQKMENDIDDIKAQIFKKDAEIELLKAADENPIPEVEPMEVPIRRVDKAQEIMKNLLREQSEELDSYIKKYETVNRKVVKQTAIIEQLDMQSKLFEQSVNNEIDDIKYKMENKVVELLKYPTKIELTRDIYKTVSEEKKEVERKLTSYSKLVKETSKLMNTKSKRKGPNCAVAIKKYLKDQQDLKDKINSLMDEREEFLKEFRKIKVEMQSIKHESSDMICLISDQNNAFKAKKMEFIEDLKYELERCKTSAGFTIKDRDDEIRELRSQIDDISYKFDEAQMEIKVLKKTLTDLTKQNL